MKRRMMAVLKGSTSASRSAKASELSDTPNSIRKMMYLTGHNRSWSPHGTLICGTFSSRARRLVSSCRAPNGQSQPQNGPRPQNSSAAATENHRMKISGSTRKYDHWKSGLSELKKARTLARSEEHTTELKALS